MSVIRRYGVRSEGGTMLVVDNETGETMARCDDAENAGLVVGALNNLGAVSRIAELEAALEMAASDSGRFTAEGYVERAASGGQ